MLTKEVIKLEVNVPIKMRDGTVLYADVWRPDTGGRYPVIMTRTPYNKNFSIPVRAGYMNPQRLARAGYAVVIQDVRGTGDSEGQAFFWKQEIEDGYDAVEGIAAQPWCDGNVGMYGLSYFGYTQWAAAAARPPHLKAICPAMTYHVPRYFPLSAKGDTFKLQIHLGWCLGRTLGELVRRNLPPKEFFPKLQEIVSLTDGIKEQLRVLPVKDAPAVKIIDEMGMMPRYADILAHSDDDGYWEGVGGPLPLEKIDIPVFHIAGWYDTEMTPGVIDSYRKIKKKKVRSQSGKSCSSAPGFIRGI
jgi:putative CocE/NonD family hydrolase